MNRRIEDLHGLGPFIAWHLAEIGLAHEDELRSPGAVETYARLRFRFGRKITLNALWALDGALSGTGLRNLPDERNQQLKSELGQRG